MIDIEVVGLSNCGPPEQERWVPRRIRKLLAKLPKEITERCSIIVAKSTRYPVNDPGKATPLIRIIGNYSDPALLEVADTLKELEDEFQLRVVDSAKVNELKEFIASFKTVEDQLS